jgi:TonB family protein
MPKPISTPPVPVPVEHHVAVNNFASAAPTPVPPKPETAKLQLKTNVFSGSSAQPTIKAPVQQVQTGGFGDPNGFRGQTDVTAKLNAPKLGGFDRPTGPGDGNGSAGAHGRPGVIASAGFGSGVATTGGSQESPGGGVHSGGFGDARAASGEPAAARSNAPAAMVPVEIVEKPQPQYTKEARDLKIEGEVHLKVLFQADGGVRVLQVVHGLGHGLDEAATSAAQKIRFKPAQRDGRPCDMTATVHIVFQLAS